MLDENYRSTGNILAASTPIRNNSARMEEGPQDPRGHGGEGLHTLLANSDLQEADYTRRTPAIIMATTTGTSRSSIANAIRLYEQKFLGILYRIVRRSVRAGRFGTPAPEAGAEPENDPTSFERAAEFAVKGMGPKRREFGP